MAGELDSAQVSAAVRRRQLGDILLLAIAMFASGVITYHGSIWLAASPPVIYHAARGPMEAVAPGSVMVLEYKQSRNRTCPADIYGWWIRSDTGAADIRLPMVSGGYSKVSDDPYWQAVVLNAPPHAGEFEYRATLIHRCANGIFVTETPPVPVVVR